MKIAVCMCGLMRAYEHTYVNFSRTLVDPNKEHEIQLFVVTEVPKNKSKDEYKSQLENFYKDFDPIIIVNEFNPEIKAGYSSFKEQFAKLEQFLDFIGEDHPYDLLVRTRSDIVFDKPIVLKDIYGIQAIGGWWTERPYECLEAQDMFFATDYPTMKLIAGLKVGHQYYLTEETPLYNWRKRMGRCAETALMLLMVYHDIPFYPIDTGYNFVRSSGNDLIRLHNPNSFAHYSDKRPIVYDKSVVAFDPKGY